MWTTWRQRLRPLTVKLAGTQLPAQTKLNKWVACVNLLGTLDLLKDPQQGLTRMQTPRAESFLYFMPPAPNRDQSRERQSLAGRVPRFVSNSVPGRGAMGVRQFHRGSGQRGVQIAADLAGTAAAQAWWRGL